MNATERLHGLGQSLWLDNITRDLLSTGALKHYIDELRHDGPHLKPHDLRPCDQEQPRL